MHALVFALPLLAASSVIQDRAKLPAFEFKGYSAGEILDAERLKSCEVNGAEVSCKIYGPVAGHDVSTYIDFYQGRMTRASVVLLDRSKLVDIVLAFQEKYGKPCEIRTETWEGAAGTKVKNGVMVWCFRTGKLTVKDIGVRLDVPWIVYSDDHVAPSAAPTVDF